MKHEEAPALSKTKVNRAAKTVRLLWKPDARSPGFDAIRGALDVIAQYRASHAVPLTKATMGLRSRVTTAGCSRVDVSQRLKRVPTILDKLRRQPTMQLSNMQDIAGCRAILEDVAEVRRVERRFKGRALRYYDYIEQPRSSGYRGLHVIVEYDGRAIEVQLRTRVMHEWAHAVERLGGRLGSDLKSGRGPRPVLEWLRAVAAAMALEERGQYVDTSLQDELEALRLQALPFLQGGHR